MGQQLLVTLQTGVCVCQYISGKWKVCEWKVSPGTVVVIQSPMSHVMNSKNKTEKNGRNGRTSSSLRHCRFLILLHQSLFSGCVLSQVAISRCARQGVDLRSQREFHVVTRTHQERAIKTTPHELTLWRRRVEEEKE